MSQREHSDIHSKIKEILRNAGLPDNGVMQEMQTGRWNEEQNRLYEQLSKIVAGQWKLMSIYITTRTSEQIRSHGQKVEKKKKLQEEVRKSKEMSANLEKYEEKTGHRATRSRLKKGSYYQKNIAQGLTERKPRRQAIQMIHIGEESPKQAIERKSRRQEVNRPKDRLPQRSFMRRFFDYSKSHENNGIPRFPKFSVNIQEIQAKESPKKEAWIKTEFHEDSL